MPGDFPHLSPEPVNLIGCLAHQTVCVIGRWPSRVIAERCWEGYRAGRARIGWRFVGCHGLSPTVFGRGDRRPPDLADDLLGIFF